MNQSNNDQDSFNNTAYKQQLKKNVESLEAAFKKMDKNSDDQLDQQEIITFLDSNMPVKLKIKSNNN
jgi:hypothetical protein